MGKKIQNFSRKCRALLSIFLSTVLLVQPTSAGIIQALRDAAFLKEPVQNAPAQQSQGVPAFTEIPDGQDSFFETRYPSSQGRSSVEKEQEQPCFPGDFLCLAQRNIKQTLGSDMSNAIIKSVAGLMTEMLNATVARSLDMVSQARSSHDQKKEVEAQDALKELAGTFAAVSGKVIQSVASFVKVSLSGAMWDFFNQVVNGVTALEEGRMIPVPRVNQGQVRGQGQGVKEEEKRIFAQDPVLIAPSSMNIQPIDGNEVRRRSDADVEKVVEMDKVEGQDQMQVA